MAGGPPRHESVPKQGSKWNAQDAEHFLGIVYNHSTSDHKDLLKRAGLIIDIAETNVPPEYDFDLDIDVDTMKAVHEFCDIDNDGSASSSADDSDHSDSGIRPWPTTTGTTTTTGTGGSDDHDTMRTIRLIVKVIQLVMDYEQKLVKMLEGHAGCNPITMPPHMDKCNCKDFLLLVRRFKDMIDMSAAGLQPDKDKFVELFQEFARMFYVQFYAVGHGSESSKTSLTGKYCVHCIQGVKVTSIPDLIYLKKFAEPVSIVTVAEVKKGCPQFDPDQSSPARTRSRSHDDEPPSKRPCLNADMADVEFPSCLKGQHATQLLFQRPYTSMKNRNCILGMVVQATKVRLTCLDMNEDHLKKQLGFTHVKGKDTSEGESEPEEACADDGRAKKRYLSKVYYTRAYDMFVRKEREVLIDIMRNLACHTDDMPNLSPKA